MRDLTEEELKLAPEWATHLYEDGHGSLRLLNMRTLMSCNVKHLPEIKGTLLLDKHHYGVSAAVPLVRKLFDISEHKFSDSSVQFSGACCNALELSVTYEQWGGHVNGYSEEEKSLNIKKQDAIAIAKALGVTGEDLL